jgi:hypothetical protein
VTNPRAFGFTDFDSLHYDLEAYTLIEDAFQNIHKIGADCCSFCGHGSNSSSPRFCHMLPRCVRLFAPFWSGQPVELRDAWCLQKRNLEAHCQLWSHEFEFRAAANRGRSTTVTSVPILDEALNTQEA